MHKITIPAAVSEIIVIALQTIGYSLGVIAIVAATVLFLMGGLSYRRPSPPKGKRRIRLTRRSAGRR